jgi:FlaA1/EpsC-like NDP-sugar epimerase
MKESLKGAAPDSSENLFRDLFHPTYVKRILFFFLFDVLIVITSLYLAFFLRFDAVVLHRNYMEMLRHALPLFLFVKLTSFSLFRMYRITWRYVGLNDLLNICSAVMVSEALLVLFILLPFPSLIPSLKGYLNGLHGFPRGIFFLDGIISIFLLSLIRISKRVAFEIVLKKRNVTQGTRTLIIGAGNTGEMVIRDMARLGFSPFYPVGLLDDEKGKQGAYIHGVQVLGGMDDLSGIVKSRSVEAIIIAIPSLSYKTLRLIYDAAKSAGIETVKIVPRIYDTHKPDIHLKDLEDIRIEDLMGRQVVQIDYDLIDHFLREKVVMVTGAGGSIGSEISMQVCAHSPRRLILFDIDETELHNLGHKLKNAFPFLFDKISFIVGDVRDAGRIQEVFRRFRPELVFHAAAYKHVPMMEYNPREAVSVNVFGTYNLAETAGSCGVKRFVMISTDKAVRPTSIMGATKRVAEYVCSAFNAASSQQGGTEFISVRFGNVLGSRGSVLPLFLDQLKNGGPLTVTHPEMKRYFMTIPEAVTLVLQASVIGHGGEVMVLDMGEPVKIVKLAEELIKLHGLEPYKDISIQFVGLRPGEKLFEEILTAEEGTEATHHEKVFVARNSVQHSVSEMQDILGEFRAAVEAGDDWSRIKDILTRHVKHYEGEGGS